MLSGLHSSPPSVLLGHMGRYYYPNFIDGSQSIYFPLHPAGMPVDTWPWGLECQTEKGFEKYFGQSCWLLREEIKLQKKEGCVFPCCITIGTETRPINGQDQSWRHGTEKQMATHPGNRSTSWRFPYLKKLLPNVIDTIQV